MNKEAWVFEYLAKGKSFDDLEKAILRMSKAETVERFRELDWGLTLAHSKNEMISVIFDTLLWLGYREDGTLKEKKVDEPEETEEPKEAGAMEGASSEEEAPRRMEDFFKSRSAFLEYTLIYGSGEQRTDLLGITPTHYADKALATRWAGELAAQISDPVALEVLRRIYRRMIGDEEAELPGEPEPVEECMEDPIGYACRHGEEALERKLEQLTMEELKAVIRSNDMDPCRQFSRTKKPEKLREVIRTVALSRLHKGDGFI